MRDWPRLISAEPLGDYRLRLTNSDGFIGDDRFADTVAEGGILAFMQDRSASRRSGARNGSRCSGDDEGGDIDFCADAQRLIAEASAVKTMAFEYWRRHDRLREIAQEQAALIAHAS